ncbi:E3 ubiquitin-protein ligase At4g11680 [Ziziphus jujuba]|uniref:RING-type E3 ubiquitin transferase n=1 Tax=Ziziphus jujuba TaxID=326968 RepID=A0A6P4AIK9_ZIZJJ|nr:E3 ubiquitin-protein ligase At4g11680 [Ziziphus jujuba]
MAEQQQQPLHATTARRTGWALRLPFLSTTTFSLPLSRYTTQLLSAADRHRILLGDCVGTQSVADVVDDDDDEDGRSFYGEACAYSKPVMVLDVVWNLAFVMVSVVVLLSSFRERPSSPLRIWVAGYALQCLLHVGCVYFDYQKQWRADLEGLDGFSSSYKRTSNAKRLETMNTLMSSLWWIIGFYWIVVGGQALLQDSPRLYWLTMVFLAFDVFFIIFCIGMACVIFFGLCCFLPILAFAYAMAIREGASEDEIQTLPKYRFHLHNPFGTCDNGKKLEIVVERLDSDNSSNVKELVLSSEDSECCICLSNYDDGAELYALPCNHHFHCGCISKWLQINATCPLCKFNIMRADTLV